MRTARRWGWAIGFLAIQVCLASQLPAQREGITSVAVAHSGTDPVGKSLCSAVRDAIRGSTGYTVGQEGKAQFEISLVTMDPDSDTANKGNWTVVAIVFLAPSASNCKESNPRSGYPIFLSGLVLRVGRYKIDEGAQRIVASLEKEIRQFRQDGKPAKEQAPAKGREPAKVEAPAQEVAPREEMVPTKEMEPLKEMAPVGETAPESGPVPPPSPR
jgi:hypothetical protein